MKCYADFFIHYCPYCGKHLTGNQKADQRSSHDHLDGHRFICSCGMQYHYFPEHKFPYTAESGPTETV